MLQTAPFAFITTLAIDVVDDVVLPPEVWRSPIVDPEKVYGVFANEATSRGYDGDDCWIPILLPTYNWLLTFKAFTFVLLVVKLRVDVLPEVVILKLEIFNWPAVV